MTMIKERKREPVRTRRRYSRLYIVWCVFLSVWCVCLSVWCVCLFGVCVCCVCLCVYESVCVCVHLLMVFCQTNHAPLSSLQQSAEDPKWLISLKSAGYLIIGVSMVRSQTCTVHTVHYLESRRTLLLLCCVRYVCAVLCVCTYVHMYMFIQ